MAQINPTVGDLNGNAEKIVEYIRKAKKKNADLVVFPELAVTGYPPKDLLLKPSFIRKNREKVEEIVKATKDIAAVVGFVDSNGNKIYNTAVLARNKGVLGVQHKTHLPNYDVFDEKRYFQPAAECKLFELGNLKIGINICEDIWVEEGPTSVQAKKGAQLIINISASPFYAGKIKVRKELLARRARENKVAIVYANLVGGQDDLVFDGGSCIFNEKGELTAQCRRFEEDLIVSDLKVITMPEEDPLEEIYRALILGIRDYVRKNGFTKVVIGLSGGIDSALTAALAAKALGAENVAGVSMPSRITSRASIEDAKKVAENLGIELKIILIADAVDAYAKMLSKEFKGTKQDVTEENIQARIRGNILMALSNKFGYLVLTTGNKSELAVGYVTLYGDMAGGLAAISDVPKTMVYGLVNYINAVEKKELIPKSIIIKEPSAELRKGQKDRNDLPPYDILDPLLHAYIEEDKSKEEIIALGYDAKTVTEVIWKIDHNEYKRQQAALGIKITPRAFGFGRRMPITNKYEG
ncbi:MAG: NAD+ synthase [Euryarchaeota archaeon]|nr:NAD+ synthase [Euryarchaeota archaeon]